MLNNHKVYGKNVHSRILERFKNAVSNHPVTHIKKLHTTVTLCLSAVLLAGTITSCDDEPGVTDIISEPVSVESITVNPDTLSFSFEDGQKDTTITLAIAAEVSNPGEVDINPQFILADEIQNETLAEGSLAPSPDSEGLFSTRQPLTVSTTTVTRLKLTVFIFDAAGRGNKIETILPVEGFSARPPVILNTSNPDTVVRPSTGSETIRFTAKVTDPDGQETVDRVFVELINPDDVSTGIFRMLDNGSFDVGDEVAGDSVFTVTFSVDNSSRPGVFDLFYFAFDRLGLASDTVESQIVIE